MIYSWILFFFITTMFCSFILIFTYFIIYFNYYNLILNIISIRYNYMKTECLDNFYKDLDNEISKEYSIKIKNLIDANNLDPETLAQLIEKEVNHV